MTNLIKTTFNLIRSLFQKESSSIMTAKMPEHSKCQTKATSSYGTDEEWEKLSYFEVRQLVKCSENMGDTAIYLYFFPQISLEVELEEYMISLQHDAELNAPDSGTQEEWDALTDEEQDDQWETFHYLCAQGIADDMYFYRVMMNQHLVGYVGH